MNAYPPIAEHGMIGDLQTAALVSSDATIDWWCAPRFDSPSLFASLLDHRRGGCCRLAAELPDGQKAAVRQLYLPDTAILVTRFMGPGGVGEVADLMTPLDSTRMNRHRLIRVVRVVRGTMDFQLLCSPRFDYGRAPHTLERLDDASVVFHGPGAAAVVLTSDVDGEAPPPPPPTAHGIAAEVGTAVAGTLLVAGLTTQAYGAAMITLAVLGLSGLAAAALLPRLPPSRDLAPDPSTEHQ
ncbi:trehalase-like domain-containing protein [Streptomyces sp. NPDC093795]|uniref:trehalase-like domain-containing protein n=1 Tax=Streptomyces sp. NPDC093795 TaxID=3366051 RepID=UPI0038037A97